jgi:3-oxoadipate enol-lactonase
MTNTGLEKHRLNNEEELPVVLLRGTSGQSEDWSQVVEQLTRHRRVISLNYAESVPGTDSENAPGVSDFADRVVAAARAGGTHRFDLVGYSLGAAVAASIAAEYPEMVRSLVLVSGFSYGGDPRMRLQFDLWLHLARTDKIALAKLLLVSGLSREYLSAFDENTIDRIIHSFVAMSDWPLIEQNIRVDLALDVRAGQEDQGTDIVNHREIRPDCAPLLYSGIGSFDPHCKEGRNPFRTLVFSRKASRSSLSDVDIST